MDWNFFLTFCQQALFKEISKMRLLPAGIIAIGEGRGGGEKKQDNKTVPHHTSWVWKSFKNLQKMFTDQKLTLKLHFIRQLKGLWYNNFDLIISQV